MTQERPTDPFPVSVINASKAHAEGMYPNYSVGIVRDGVYYPCTNDTYATNIEAKINPIELAQHQALGTVQAVVYSHPKGDNSPTLSERQDCKDNDLTWGIAPVVQGIAQDMIWWGDAVTRSPLLDRSFILGVWDCYDLFRDWWILTHSVYPPQVVHDVKSTQGGRGLFLDNYVEGGLEELGLLPIESMLEGDMVLLTIESSIPNHCGVYVGNGEFIHYPPNSRKSEQHELINWWANYSGILRRV